jgi:hypothetical protein
MKKQGLEVKFEGGNEMSANYEYAEIHSKAMSIMKSARAFAKRVGCTGDDIVLYIDQELQRGLELPNIEEAQIIREAVNHEQGRRMREAKKQKATMPVKNGSKSNNRRVDPIARLNEMRAEFAQYEARMREEIAQLEAELSKPKTPQQFSCKWFSVQKGDSDDVWVIRTLERYGRTYLGRMTMSLEKVNAYAENIESLIETVLDDRGM